MRVTTPSTSGCTVDDRFDRIVAMNPDDCSIGFFCSVSVDTPIGGGGPAADAGVPLRVHAAPPTSSKTGSATARRCGRVRWKDIAPEGYTPTRGTTLR